MSDSPAAKMAGEALGSLIGVLLTSGIDREMQRSAAHVAARIAKSRMPLRRKLGRAFRRMKLKPPAD